MSKRQRERRSSRYYCEGLFLQLPRELWQRLIYPLVGLGPLLATASVSREWKAQLVASVNELSWATVSFANLSLATCPLSKTYLAQFCSLSAAQIDLRIMRHASAFAGLAQLSSLRTLCLRGETLLANGVSRLTQITALDDCTTYGGTEQALLSPNLRLFRAAHRQPCSYHLNNLVDLPQLTYLDLRHSSMYSVQHILTALTALQFLALGAGYMRSYDFLTGMHDLVFLRMDNCSGAYSGSAPSADHLTALTALTSLSGAGMPLPLIAVQAMTKLRSLQIGDAPVENDKAMQLFRGAVTLVSLTRELLETSLAHIRYVSYRSQNIFQLLTPLKVLELGLHHQSNELEEVAAFRGWKHPLPDGYFSLNLPMEHEGRFLNGQAFI